MKLGFFARRARFVGQACKLSTACDVDQAQRGSNVIHRQQRHIARRVIVFRQQTRLAQCLPYLHVIELFSRS